jgi:hypothetical protein
MNVAQRLEAEGRTNTEYPEHAKMLTLRCPGSPDDPFASHNYLVGDFITWLTEDQGYVIAKWRPTHCTRCDKPWTDFRRDDGAITCEACGAAEFHRSDDVLLPSHRTVEQLLAGFFGIDQEKIEAEKRQMLDRQRAMNVASPEGA